jgi:hypothetical protein
MRARVLMIAACASLALLGCGKDKANSTENEPSARDAAPGRLSEATPPSASVNESAQSKPSSDTADQQPQH